MTSANRLLRTALFALFLSFPLTAPAADQNDDLEGLEWRLVGPWRGVEHVAIPGG